MEQTMAPETLQPPDYPPSRDARCPFDLPTLYRELRERAPLTRVRVWDGSTPWLVTRHADALQALNDPALVVDSDLPGFPVMSAAFATRFKHVRPFFFRDEASYQSQRAMIINEFAPRRIESLRPAVERIVNETVDALLTLPGKADLMPEFALPIATRTMCTLLGVSDHQRLVLHELSRVLASRTAGPEEVAQALNGIDAYFLGVIDDHLHTPADDLVGRALVPHIDAGDLSREDAATMVQVLFTSGHGTTTPMIATSIAALFAHPEQLARLRASREPRLFARAVDELFRYVTVAHIGRARIAASDTTIGDTRIRAGDGVLIQLDAANRDPEQFPEPDTFDIHRTPRRHLALGHGIHKCMGQALAKMELHVSLETLLRRLPHLRVDAGPDALPFADDENALRLQSLPVTW
ncbi:cytochrome P450 [Streptomyces sp. NPDC048297]|uniref:cytochrome P450 n=1 Tax=Streptomyces sp. NPDC048297 TaxID=3365531 RepID=UPI003718F835